jgi:hypothetical protein
VGKVRRSWRIQSGRKSKGQQGRDFMFLYTKSNFRQKKKKCHVHKCRRKSNRKKEETASARHPGAFYQLAEVGSDVCFPGVAFPLWVRQGERPFCQKVRT